MLALKDALYSKLKGKAETSEMSQTGYREVQPEGGELPDHM